MLRSIAVLIQIARAASLTLQNAELQALKVGEIYDVAPAIGQVLVTDGWAREVIAGATADWRDESIAHDDPGEHEPRS
jgi:hypothetical protein